jgi:hypothetical protein
MVTGEVSAQNLREKAIKNIIEEGKIEGKIEGYRECRAAHKEIENCHCKSCVEAKFAYWNLKIKSDPKTLFFLFYPRPPPIPYSVSRQRRKRGT